MLEIIILHIFISPFSNPLLQKNLDLVYFGFKKVIMMKDLGSYLDLSLLCSFLVFSYLLFTTPFIFILDNKQDNIIIPTLLNSNLGKPILAWYHQEPPQGMVKEQKTAKSFFWALFVYFFHNYKLLFFHVYHLQTIIYGLKFIWELKKLKASTLEIHN